MVRDDSVVVVTDANVIINFIHIEALHLLALLPGLQFVVPEHVVAEVTEPAQAAALKDVIDSGGMEEFKITEIPELERFAALTGLLGKGESACLALAESRGWSVASDERRAYRRIATEMIGVERLLTTSDLIVKAIHGGLVSVDQADRWKTVLDENRFTMRFMSFSELI